MSFLAFVVAVPTLHWLPLIRFTGPAGAALINYDAVTAYDVLGILFVIGAICLNAVAAKQLGKVCVWGG